MWTLHITGKNDVIWLRSEWRRRRRVFISQDKDIEPPKISHRHTRQAFRLFRTENLGIMPMWEQLYCSALTGKCTRCVKECLCLSLSTPLSNPPFSAGLKEGFS